MGTLVSSNANSTATVYTAATEVVAISSVDANNTLDAEQSVTISGTVSFTAGATGGTVSARIRQGTGLAGATVATIPLTNAIASIPNSYSFTAVDTAPVLVGPGNAGLPLYTVTLTVAGSNGTGSYACIAVSQNTATN